MSIWFLIAVAFLLFVVLEEAIHYSWNRYVYGKNVEMRRIWKNKLVAVLKFFKRTKPIVIETNNQEKSSR